MSANPTLETTLPQMLAAQDLTVEQMNEKMQAVHGPGWDARHDYSKTLIAIASATFGAIIAFSNEVFAQSGIVDRWLIIVALALFVVTIGLSLGTIYQRVGLSGFRARYFNQRDEIVAKSEKVDLTSLTAYEELTVVFKGAIDVALEPIGQSDKRAHNFSIWSGVTFLVALILFLIAIIFRYAFG